MKRISFIAWCTLSLALIAWAGVGFFAWTISGAEDDRRARLSVSHQSSSDAASAVRTHTLAGDTAQARAALETLLNADVVSVANAIESSGKAIGVATKVSSVLPAGAPFEASGGSAVQIIGFVVSADGKFSLLMRAVQLFESLPAPSKIDRFDISQTPNAGSAAADAWHLDLEIKVLTTSMVSS